MPWNKAVNSKLNFNMAFKKKFAPELINAVNVKGLHSQYRCLEIFRLL